MKRPRPAAHAPQEPALITRIRESLIGELEAVDGPFGPRKLTYADYTASGRSLGFIEDYIRAEILPFYANTHTEASATGRQTNRYREDARQLIRTALGADDSVCVIFCGSGTTGAVDRLIGALGLRSTRGARPAGPRPVVFLGPFEHHSNELPWRESAAEVVPIRADADGHIDRAHLAEQLRAYADRPVRIGSFSAASNVTGILSDTAGITRLLHEHGALAFWDFAAAAPYVDVDLGADGDPAAKDAVFLSPHKFVGGPGTPGVLAVRRRLLTAPVPVVIGGGTVTYVSPVDHEFLLDPQYREEGGTPEIVGSIRAGLVFQLRQAVGAATIRTREADFTRRALAAWQRNPNLRILGNTTVERLAIISFVVAHPDGRCLHHNLVVALLNDLFGIQARGGCSCAGPYGHELLHVDSARSRRIQRQVLAGWEGIKPGWTRVGFNYFLTEDTFDYIVRAVDLLATHGWSMLGEYAFDPATGQWRHRAAGSAPLRRLDQWSPLVPHHRATEAELPGYLAEARRIFAAHADRPPEPPGSVNADFDELRWFDLPLSCLSDQHSRV